MGLEKVSVVNKKGKSIERYVIAKLSPEAKDLLKNGKFLAFVDQKAGVAYAVEMRMNRLSDEEKKARAKDKAEKREKFVKKRRESAEAAMEKAKERLKKWED